MCLLAALALTYYILLDIYIAEKHRSKRRQVTLSQVSIDARKHKTQSLNDGRAIDGRPKRIDPKRIAGYNLNA